MNSKIIIEKNQKAIFYLFLFFIVTFILYIPVINAPFVFDDYDFIINNAHIKNFFKFNIIPSIFSRKGIVNLTFALNYLWSGTNPSTYHLVNILIHMLNGFILFHLIRRILYLCKINLPVAFYSIFALLVSGLFLVHPIQTQSVSYIWERTELLGSLFYLLSYFFYIKGRIEDKSRYFILSLLCLGIGFFAKEIVISIPLLILMSEFLFFSKKKLSFSKLTLFSLSILVCFVGVFLFYHGMRVIRTGNYFSYWDYTLQYWLAQIKTIIKYIQLSILPINQNFDYDFNFFFKFDFISILSLFIIFLIIYISFILSKKHVLASFGIFWFFILLLPTSIIPTNTPIFEHRVYLALVGIIFIFVYLVSLIKNRRLKISVFIVVLMSLSYLTIKRNFLWSNPIYLMEDTVKKSPFNARAHIFLGSLYYQEGRYVEALAILERARKLSPLNPHPYNNIGLIYLNYYKDYRKAENFFKKAIILGKNYVDPYVNLSFLYYLENKLEEAKILLKEALSIPTATNRDKLFVGLGNIYYSEEKYKEAEGAFGQAIQINPDNYFAYYNLGNLYFKEKKYNLSLDCYEKAIALNSNFLEAYLNMSRVYYILGDYNSSWEYINKAKKISPDDPRIDYIIRYFKEGMQ